MNYRELSHVATMAAQLSEGYTVENDVIKNPGKFEGEGVAALYYYDCYLNGNGAVMEVSEEERAAFDLAEDDKYVYLAESNDGFVSLEFYATQEQAEAREGDEFEEDEPEEEEPVNCPMCNGQAGLLGTLGNTSHYRCINCGWQFTA